MKKLNLKRWTKNPRLIYTIGTLLLAWFMGAFMLFHPNYQTIRIYIIIIIILFSISKIIYITKNWPTNDPEN